jgi:hypothetical protein
VQGDRKSDRQELEKGLKNELGEIRSTSKSTSNGILGRRLRLRVGFFPAAFDNLGRFAGRVAFLFAPSASISS